VPRKALRWQGQASTDSAPGSDISALGAADSIPPVSVTIGGHRVSNAPALPSPNPTPSVGAALLEAEVEKSIQIGMGMLEQPPQFRPDPTLEGALPQESVAPLPPTTEVSGSTARVGAGARAQEVAKEAAPKDPLAQVGSTTGGGS
jgi:hypothetical protein